MYDSHDILMVGGGRQDVDAVRNLLGELGGPVHRIEHERLLAGGLDRLASRPIDVILLDRSVPDSTPVEAVIGIRAQAPSVPILIWSGEEDEQLAYAAMRNGAEDFLVKSHITGQALARAIRYAIARRTSNTDTSGTTVAPVIGFLGAKGGVGTTTLVCHVAAAVTGLTGKPVLLADLDLFCGQVGFHMRARSDHSIADAAASIHRLDSDFWRAIATKTATGVDVVLAPGLHCLADPPAAHRVRQVLRTVRPWYSMVLVDLGSLNSFSSEILVDLTQLVLVTTPELPSLSQSRLIVREFPGLGVAPERTNIALNRHTERDVFSPKEAEELLGLPFCAVLPDAAAALAKAHASGELLSSKETLHRHFVALAALLSGSGEPQPRAGFLDRVFGMAPSGIPSRALACSIKRAS